MPGKGYQQKFDELIERSSRDLTPEQAAQLAVDARRLAADIQATPADVEWLNHVAELASEEARAAVAPGVPSIATGPTGSGTPPLSRSTIQTVTQTVGTSTVTGVDIPFGQVFMVTFKVWASLVILGLVTGVALALLFSAIGLSLFN